MSRKLMSGWRWAAMIAICATSLFAQSNEADARKIAAYPLTLDLFHRYAAVTIDFAKLSKTDPARNQLKGLESLPLDNRVQRMESTAASASILKAHGISARDMVMTSAAVTALFVVKAATQTGAGRNDANKLEWEATGPDHLKFYDAHKADFDKYQADLMSAVRR